MKLGIDGVQVGHWTDDFHQTGCTVVLLPEGTIGSGEVRGGAPATREFALLDPTKLVQRLDAVVLDGWLGIRSRDRRWCRRLLCRARPWLRHTCRKGADRGCDGALRPRDRRCAGTPLRTRGASRRARRPRRQLRDRSPRRRYGRHRRQMARSGPGHPGRFGCRRRVAVTTSSSRRSWPSTPPATSTTALRRPRSPEARSCWPEPVEPLAPAENTTIGVIVTNARIDKMGCQLVAQSGHDGLARSLFPAHTRGDGDALVVAATQGIDATVDVVRILAVVAVEQAVRSVQTR